MSETFFDQPSTTKGRYIPVFAAEVYDQNKRLVGEGLAPINLTSIMIGMSAQFVHFLRYLDVLQGMDSLTFIPCCPHIMIWRAPQCLCPQLLISGMCIQTLLRRCISNPVHLGRTCVRMRQTVSTRLKSSFPHEMLNQPLATEMSEVAEKVMH